MTGSTVHAQSLDEESPVEEKAAIAVIDWLLLRDHKPPQVPSSSRLTAITPGGFVLYAANPESGVVSAINIRTNTVIEERDIGGVPSGIALHPVEQRLYVTNSASNELVVIDLNSFSTRRRISLNDSPQGVVVDSQGRRVYVTETSTDAVAVIDAASAQIVDRITTIPGPRALAITGTGATLYVTHFLTGNISVIDTASRSVTKVIETGADSNFAQSIVIHPENGKAYLPHIRSNVSNPNLLFDSAMFPVVSAIDLATESHLPADRMDLSIVDRPVNLPLDIGFSPDGETMLVANMGSGDVSVVELDTRTGLAHIEVGDLPRGVSITPDGHTAYVLNSLSYDISVIDLDSNAEIMRIPLSTGQSNALIDMGKLFFFSSRSARTSRDQWMSCGSCHFFGEHDGRTWRFTDGPRNTTSLRGLSQTRPLHWSADRDELQDFEFTIRQLQAGTGLIESAVLNQPLGAPNAGLSVEMDAMSVYVDTLQPKTSPFLNSDGSLTAAATRGKAIFERADTGCQNCHSGPAFTDSNLFTLPFIVHDVGTGDGPGERLGPAFDTPTLLGIWDTAPYLHDGSAPTLEEVLILRNPGDAHGNTSHLSTAEISDLVQYLRSL